MKKEIKVLQVVSNFKKNGPAFVALDLASGLKENNIKVIVASSGGVLVDNLKELGIEHLYIPIGRKKGNKIATLFKYSYNFVLSILSLIKCVKKHGINIIHAHQPLPIFLSLIITKILKIPLVTTAHNIYNPRIKRNTMYTKGNKVISVSEQVRHNLISNFKVKDTTVLTIHNGIDVERVKVITDALYREGLGIRSDEKVIGVVAGLRKQKALDVFLKAAKLVSDSVEDVKFLIVGDGVLRNDLEKLCNTLGLTDKVIFAGFRNDVLEIINNLDVFCLSSDYEGLPISLLEAMANNTPVVVTSVGGIPELIRDGYNGILVPPQNEARLASALIKVLTDESLREALKNNAYNSVIDNFNNIIMAKKHLEVYHDLFENKK